MSRPLPAVGYAAILRLPGVPRLLAAALLGRLSYGMVSLALIVTIQDATGSYTTAGTALGGYAATTLLMPVKARVVDRYGLAAVLPVLSVGFTAALLGLAAWADRGGTIRLVAVALSTAAGLAAPPLGPSMRALWAALTPEAAARRRAYSLDGVLEEIAFALSPLLVGAILLVAAGPAATVTAALLSLAGTVGMATSAAACRRQDKPAAEPPGERRPEGRESPFSHRGFVVLVLVMAAVGFAGGPLEVALVARSQQQGRPAGVGYLLAALAVGSAVGGLLWGRLSSQRGPRVELAGLAGLSALAGFALVPTTSLPLLGALLVVAGLAGAPMFVVAHLTADDLVAGHRRQEALTWVTTAFNAGVALGAAAAGVLVDHGGPGLALFVGALGYAVTAVMVTVLGRRLEFPGRPVG